MAKRLLLISNSTNAGEEYLAYPMPHIQQFLAGTKITKALFFPFAAVTFSYDEYEAKVQKRFNELGVEVESIHRKTDPVQAVADAQLIVVGGGNTFHLLKTIQDLGLIEPVRKKVLGGTPYIGWSAGSNLTCPTICTTNDMPIVEPQSFNAFNLISFQINPHYLDAHPDGHAGETREQRLLEYIAANPDKYVAGLREGCMFVVEGDSLKLIGPRPVRVFKKDVETRELSNDDDFSFLMK